MDEALLNRAISALYRLHRLWSRRGRDPEAFYYLGQAHAFEDIRYVLLSRNSEIKMQDLVDELEQKIHLVEGLEQRIPNPEGRETP